jgi:hypothetical protein
LGVWQDAVAHVSNSVNAKSLYLTPGAAELDAAGTVGVALGAALLDAGAVVAGGAALLARGAVVLAAVAGGTALLATGAVVTPGAALLVGEPEPGVAGESVPAHAAALSPASSRKIEE